MNFKFASMVFMLVGALAFEGVGCAQPSGGPQQQMPQQTPQQMPQQMPRQTPPYTTPRNGMNGPMNNFSQLAGSKGYVTQQDAQRDPWLSSHFTDCDTNRDGKVDRREYSQCRQGQGMMRQPQQPPPSSAR